MLVKDLISEGLLPAARTDTVGDVLSLAIYGELKHMPVVDEEGKLCGMIRLSTLLDESDVGKTIGDLPFDAPVSVPEDAHIFEAIQHVVDRSIEVLPVVTRDGTYRGSIGLANVLGPISRMLGTEQPGAVLEIEMNASDYSLRHMVHGIEESGARVISLTSMQVDAAADRVAFTVKVSVEDTSRIRAVLEHLGYQVNRDSGSQIDDDELQHRVAEFMHYLDV